MLSSKVDQLARAGDNSDSFAILEQRIAALTSTLESRERPAASENSEQLEGALRALSDRLDRMPVGNDSASAFAHLEQRVSYLLERLESSSDHRARQSRAGRGRAAGHPAPSRNPACELRRAGREQPQQRASAVDGLRPGRYRQARIVRHPLQPVRNRPPHPGFARSRSQHARPCGRSSGDDRRRPAQRARRTGCAAGSAAAHPRSRAAPRAAMPPQAMAASRELRRMPPQPKPELPNPAAAQEHFAAAPREFHAAEPPAARCRRRWRRARSAKFWSRTPRRRAPRSSRSCRRIIRWSRAPGRPDAAVVAVGAHRGFRKRDQRNSGRQRRSRSAHRASSPPRAAPPRPPPPQPANDKAARQGRVARPRPRRRQGVNRRTTRSRRPSPPRSARCWSARAWS